MSTAKKKDKMVPLPLRVPESVAKELKTEAKEKGQPVSKIALSRIQHHQNSLTPELMVHLQNIVNTAVEYAGNTKTQELQKEMSHLWKSLK